jgi:hypothetical protein
MVTMGKSFSVKHKEKKFNIYKNQSGIFFVNCKNVSRLLLDQVKKFQKGQQDFMSPRTFCIYENQNGKCRGDCQYACHFRTNANKTFMLDQTNLNIEEDLKCNYFC